jgi:hypothetical protein
MSCNPEVGLLNRFHQVVVLRRLEEAGGAVLFGGKVTKGKMIHTLYMVTPQ